MFSMRLVLFLFLSSTALMRRAQNEFYKNDGQNPLRGLFQFEGGNVAHNKESFNDGNIQKVIGILQNNIKQWSFIESQLLEPNVNLGMPEIFIPLKHLTTTLEILGNVFYLQNDLLSAQSSLERACPLMELLPASVLSEEDFVLSGEVLGESGLQLDHDLSALLWMGGGGGVADVSTESTGDALLKGSGSGNSYATSCFALLRDVYSKLYNDALPPPPKKEIPDVMQFEYEVQVATGSDSSGTSGKGSARGSRGGKAGRTSGATTSASTNIPSPQEQSTTTTPKHSTTTHHTTHPTTSSTSVNGASSGGGMYTPHSYLLPNGKPREFNLKYLLSKRQQRQQMKQRALYSKFNSSATLTRTPALHTSHAHANTHTNPTYTHTTTSTSATAKSTKVSGARMSMSATTATTAYLEKSLLATQQDTTHSTPNTHTTHDTHHTHNINNKNNKNNNNDVSSVSEVSSGEQSVEQGHRRRDHTLLQGQAGDYLYDTTSTDTTTGDTTSTTTSTSSGVKQKGNKEPRRTSVFSAEEEEDATTTTPTTLTTHPTLSGDSTSASGSSVDARQPSPLLPVPSETARRRHAEHIKLYNDMQTLYTEHHARKCNFQFELKMKELRSPYQHLRSELSMIQGHSDVMHTTHTTHTSDTSEYFPTFDPTLLDDETSSVYSSTGTSDSSATSSGGSSDGKRGLGLRKSHTTTPTFRGFEGSSLNSISGADITAAGVSTSIIADDLEVLLRRFVSANRRVRRELLVQARRYYDELDINFPNMDYNEYAANMDVGQAFVEVMRRAAEEGLAFVHTELEGWKAAAAKAQRSSTSGTSSTSSGKGSKKNKIKSKASTNTPTTNTTPTNTPLRVTMAEKNRLLVLYAFDIVHTDPTDLFDLGLGFNRGIVDNDRTRRGEYFMADALNDAVASLGIDSVTSMLGMNSDDAHTRLFPLDGSGNSISSDKQSEQHLRELLTEGEYTHTTHTSTTSTSKKKSKRRQRQMEGGVYTSDTSSSGSSNSGSSGSGGYFATDRDGAGDLFDDDVLGNALRSSVPSLEGDWTLYIFILFMLLTAAVVYSAYHEAWRKKSALRRGMRTNKKSGTSGSVYSNSVYSGSGLVDFMYAQINTTVEEDSGGSDDVRTSSVGGGSSNTSGSGGSVNSPLRQLSNLFFPKTDTTTSSNGTSNGSSGTSNSSNTSTGSNKVTTPNNNTSNGKTKKVHTNTTNASTTNTNSSTVNHTNTTSNNTTTTTITSNTASDTTNSSNNTSNSNTSSNGTNNTSNTSGVGKGGRNKKGSVVSTGTKASSTNTSTGANTSNTTTNTSTTGTATSTTTSNATTDTTSTTDSTITSTNNTTTSIDDTTTNNTTYITNTTPTTTTTANNTSNTSSDDESYIHTTPVVLELGHRRVSWAGLIPGATLSTATGGADLSEEGTWAEARKKSKRNNTSGSASSSGGGTNSTGGDDGSTSVTNSTGNGSSNGNNTTHTTNTTINSRALGLKDAPAYRPSQPVHTLPHTLPHTLLPYTGPRAAPRSATTSGGIGGVNSGGTTSVPFSRTSNTYSTGNTSTSTNNTNSNTASTTSNTANTNNTTTNTSTNTNTTTSTSGKSGSGKVYYDLSEAKRLAEQMGGWASGGSTSGGSGVNGTGGSTSGVGGTGATAYTSNTTHATASKTSAPPGLLPMRSGSTNTATSTTTPTLSPSHSTLHSLPPLHTSTLHTDTLHTLQPLRSPSTQQFGFSQFDLNSSAYSSGIGSNGSSAGASGGVWSSSPSLAALTASLSGTSGNVYGSSNGVSTSSGSGELSHGAYLGDLVSYLDSSTSSNTTSTTSNTTGRSVYSTSNTTSLYTDPYHSRDSLYHSSGVSNTGATGTTNITTNTSSTANTITSAAATITTSSNTKHTSNTTEVDGSAGLSSDYDSLDDSYYHVPSTTHTTANTTHTLPLTDEEELYYQQYHQYDSTLYTNNTTSANNTTDTTDTYYTDTYDYTYDTTYSEEYSYSEYSDHVNGIDSSTSGSGVGSVSGGVGSTSGTSGGVRRDHGGLRQSILSQPSAHFASSITVEASTLYGLSPDAPSFRPSQHRSSGVGGSGGIGVGLFGTTTGIDDSITSTSVSGTSIAGTASGTGFGAGLGLSLFGDSLTSITMQQPSASSVTNNTTYTTPYTPYDTTFTTPYTTDNTTLYNNTTPYTSTYTNNTTPYTTTPYTNNTTLFNSDDFYESILIDSILNGEEHDLSS